MSSAVAADDIPADVASTPPKRKSFSRGEKAQTAVALLIILYSLFAGYVYLTQGARAPDELTNLGGRSASALANVIRQIHWGLAALLVAMPLFFGRSRLVTRLGHALFRALLFWAIMVTSMVCGFILAPATMQVERGLIHASASLIKQAVVDYHTQHGAYPARIDDALSGWRYLAYRVGPECRVVDLHPPVLVYPPWKLSFADYRAVPL